MKTADSERLRLALMAAEHVERIGARIRKRREELGLSRDDVASEMPGKTNGNAIYRWEKGLHQPSPDTLEALAKVLGVETSYFYVDAPEKDGDTPDLMGTVNGGMATEDLREQLLALDGKLDQILGVQAKLERRLANAQADHKLLDRINRDVEAIRATIDADAETDDGEQTQPGVG